MKKQLLFIWSVFAAISLSGQHFQFTQFYAAPMHLNPAFTGDNVCSRVSTNYRDQWPGVTGRFVTYQVSYDTYIMSKNSGLGAMVMTDRSGSGNLLSNTDTPIVIFHIALGWHR